MELLNCPAIGLEAKRLTIPAESRRATHINATDSPTVPSARVALEAPSIFLVFTPLSLTGTRAKKKLMKLMKAIRVTSTAMASRVIVDVLLPERPGVPTLWSK